VHVRHPHVSHMPPGKITKYVLSLKERVLIKLQFGRTPLILHSGPLLNGDIDAVFVWLEVFPETTAVSVKGSTNQTCL